MKLTINNMRQRNSGFTIVELLIVIIVISILSAITVFAYNGARERAINAKIQSAVTAMEKALKVHRSSSDSPLKSPIVWYHASIVQMAGVCVGSGWPSDSEMQKAVGGYTGYTLRALYCGWYSNAAVSIDDVTQQWSDAVAASTVATAFPKVNSVEPITVAAVAANSTVTNYTIRGLRYAYNNSTTSPTGYIYYLVTGKTCFSGDTTVRFQDTMWTAVGGPEWNGTFTTGGDYTANNTASCMRTIKY